jgi:hypothetical protein
MEAQRCVTWWRRDAGMGDYRGTILHLVVMVAGGGEVAYGEAEQSRGSAEKAVVEPTRRIWR